MAESLSKWCVMFFTDYSTETTKTHSQLKKCVANNEWYVARNKIYWKKFIGNVKRFFFYEQKNLNDFFG